MIPILLGMESHGSVTESSIANVKLKGFYVRFLMALVQWCKGVCILLNVLVPLVVIAEKPSKSSPPYKNNIPAVDTVCALCP